MARESEAIFCFKKKHDSPWGRVVDTGVLGQSVTHYACLTFEPRRFSEMYLGILSKPIKWHD